MLPAIQAGCDTEGTFDRNEIRIHVAWKSEERVIGWSGMEHLLFMQVHEVWVVKCQQRCMELRVADAVNVPAEQGNVDSNGPGHTRRFSARSLC
jgi:hypothetical protein